MLEKFNSLYSNVKKLLHSKNVLLISSLGGDVQLDTEDFFNSDKYGNDGLNEKYSPLYHPNNFNFGDRSYVVLDFCRIGESINSASNEIMEIGEFPNSFGFFIHFNATCPMLKGPSGLLQGLREELLIDLEDSFNMNQINGPAPFLKVGDGNFKTAVCRYNPKN